MNVRCQKILIVDDDPMLAKTLADILRFKQYDARVAHSAFSALQTLGLAGESECSQAAFIPDYIISDVKMPGMNGVELFRKLQHDLPDVPMILMTAYTEEQLLQEGLAEGVLEVLTKPLSIPSLLTILAGG